MYFHYQQCLFCKFRHTRALVLFYQNIELSKYEYVNLLEDVLWINYRNYEKTISHFYGSLTGLIAPNIVEEDKCVFIYVYF